MLRLLMPLALTTSYNPAADSFQWSPIALNFRTNVMDKINISSSANFDPYAFDYVQDRRLPILMEEEGLWPGPVYIRYACAWDLIFTQNPKVMAASDPTNSEEYGRIMRNAGYNDYVDMNIPWSFNVSYSLSANKTNSVLTKRDTTVVQPEYYLPG